MNPLKTDNLIYSQIQSFLNSRPIKKK